MGNMSYCRFENTIKDIADCIDALDGAGWDLDEMSKNAFFFPKSREKDLTLPETLS